MEKRKLICLALIGIVILCFTGPAMAGSDTKPINISLFNPLQIFDETFSISGFRLNLIYGVNADIRGLDIGLVNETRDQGKALQIGIANLAGGDFSGWQLSGINIVNGSFHGLQTALFNSAKEMKGLQPEEANVFFGALEQMRSNRNASIN